MGWKTIDSAPRDGTRVMLYKWHEGMGWHVYGHGYWEGGDSIVSGWLSQGLSDPPGNLGLAAPTHWCAIKPPIPMER